MSAPSAPTSEVWPVWTDFVDNWRATDAHWFRDRVVNIFDNDAARTASGIAPLGGTLSFLQDVNSLEFYKSTGGWESVRYPNLAVASDVNGVTLRRTGAGSGIILGADGTANTEKLNAGLGALVVNSTSLSVKTGARTVVLTTDATSLAVNSPVKITGDVSAATATIAGAMGVGGTLTVPNIAMSGTLSGGTINGSSGTIGGVALTSNRVQAASGLLSGAGHFYGDGGSALMRHSSDTGPYIQAGTSSVNIAGGGVFDVFTTLRMRQNNIIQYYYAGDGAAVNIAPSFYSGGDPGAGNFPDGTIWIS